MPVAPPACSTSRRGTSIACSPSAETANAIGRSVGMNAKPGVVEDVVRIEEHGAGERRGGEVLAQPLDARGVLLARYGYRRQHAESLLTTNTDRLALRATLHCLTGCGIGEVLGLVIATALGWGDVASIALAIALAFLFGYAFTFVPLIRGGLAVGAAVGIALAADTISITVMEIVDNAIILAVPGAMEAGLDSLLFWGSLALALAVAFVAAYPVNRWLIARGRGHAIVHGHH